MEQAQGLVQRAKLLPHFLTDARDLTGERLRLWDVFDSADRARVTPVLSEAFHQVSWIPHPMPAAVWAIDLARADAELPEEAYSWRSAPVGVVYIDALGRAPRGYAVQAQMQRAFQGFQQVQYLGVLSSRSGFDLLHSIEDLFSRVFRRNDSHLRKQVQVFRKWCLEWRRKHWFGHRSQASFTTDGGMGK